MVETELMIPERHHRVTQLYRTKSTMDYIASLHRGSQHAEADP